MRASLIVPTLNEGGSVAHVIATFLSAAATANRDRFKADPIRWEVLVVDGASTDGTAERARNAGAQVISEPRKGYGRAYRTGFSLATGDVIATADGDATYPVDEIPALVGRLLEERLDFISGDRLTYLNRKSMTTEHRIGNRALNLFLQLAYRRYLEKTRRGTLVDSQSGLWILRREILPQIRLTQDGMEFSEEIKLEAILRGFQFEEIPIPYTERWGRPKLSSWRDGEKNLVFLWTKRLALAREERRQESEGAVP